MPGYIFSTSMVTQHKILRVGAFKRSHSYLSFKPIISVERCTLAFERIRSFVHVVFRIMRMLLALLSK